MFENLKDQFFLSFCQHFLMNLVGQVYDLQCYISAQNGMNSKLMIRSLSSCLSIDLKYMSRVVR